MPQTDRPASPWLIAERARCRRDGLLLAKDWFTRLSWPEAMAKLEEKVAGYDAIMKDPKPTGIPGE